MSEHLNEQPWYDYQICLSSAVEADRNSGAMIGEIFLCRVATVDPDIFPNHYSNANVVFKFFYALKLCEGGEPHDRYRMCLFQEPLKAQRVLRGIEPPVIPKYRNFNGNSGQTISFNPQGHANGVYRLP